MAVEADEGVGAVVVPADLVSSKMEVKGCDIDASRVDSNTGATFSSCSIWPTGSRGGNDTVGGTSEDNSSREGDNEGCPADVDSRILLFDTAESSMSGACGESDEKTAWRCFERVLGYVKIS